MKRVVRIGLALIVAAVIGWYLYAHGSDFLLLAELDFRYLAPMLAVPLAAIWVNGRILKLLVGQLGIQLTAGEWFGLTVIQAFGNYLPIPQGGTIARGVYLKKTHGLDYASFTATVFVTYVEFLTCAGFSGLLVGALMELGGQPLPLPFWLLFGALACTLLFFLPIPWPVPVARRLDTFRKALATLRRRNLLLRVGTYQCALVALGVAGLWLAFASLARPVSASASALLSLVSMTSGIINVTPGNVGVAEFAAWITARLTGGNPEEAVVAFTMYRLMAVVVVFVLTPFFTSRLSVSFTTVRPEDPAEQAGEGV